MAYFIFVKNTDGQQGTLVKIAANDIDLNNLNINISDYTILQDTDTNFNYVRLCLKTIQSYSGSTINYLNVDNLFIKKTEDTYSKQLEIYIKQISNQITCFLNVNVNHPDFQKWLNYKNYINSLDLTTITYPLSISLEQYVESMGYSALNTLQLP